MTVYRRNPLLMTVMGANPGGPAFIVIDSVTGRVMYTKRATGMGNEAINSCALAARRFAQKTGHSQIVYLDLSRARVGETRSVSMARVMGITEEIHPDGTVTRNNPVRRRRAPDDAIDTAIGHAWAQFMSGVQVPIMDIPRIFRDIKLEMAGGATLEQAVVSVGQRYRVNRNPGGLGAAVVGGIAGAVANRVLSNPHLEGDPCPACSGSLAYLGTLGNREHYRCRNCGMDTSTPIIRVTRRSGHRAKCGHGIPTNECRVCRGRKASSFVKPCIHGISGGGRRCVACQRLFRRGGPVRNNPAIRTQWDRLTDRRRLAVLEFSGVPYEQARRLASRSWSVLPPSIQSEVVRGWQENPTKSKVKKNPGHVRKTTMPIARFAALVKKQGDPALWKDFVAKCRAYHKWSHGSWPTKVTIERVNKPGMKGIFIAFDMGRQPESTYIMPKGSKRRGAWKHPWTRMPQMKGDPQAGLIITKLVKGNRLSEFLHG